MSNYHYLIIYMRYKIHYGYKLLKNCSCICDGRFTKFYTSFYILQKKKTIQFELLSALTYLLLNILNSLKF
jgi:hypothetical protein